VLTRELPADALLEEGGSRRPGQLLGVRLAGAGLPYEGSDQYRAAVDRRLFYRLPSSDGIAVRVACVR
jgi:hypothetical protein